MKLRRPRIEDKVERVNILPLTINFSGETEFKEYFEDKEVIANDEFERESLQNHFMGRLLKGKKIENDKITFQLYNKEIEEDVNIVYAAKVENLKYWNHDDFPGSNDRFQKIIEMLEMHQSLNE